MLLAIADISGTLRGEHPYEESLRGICQRVAELLNYDFSAIVLPDDKCDQLSIAGYWGLTESYLEIFRASPPRAINGSIQFPIYRAYESGEVQVIKDIKTDPHRELLSAFVQAQGTRAAVCVPVMRHSKVLAVLACYALVPRRFGADELKTLQAIAHVVGFAIEVADLVKSQKRTNDELEFVTLSLVQQKVKLEDLSSLQTTLLNSLTTAEPSVLEATVLSLASFTRRSVAIATVSGQLAAFAGTPEARQVLGLIANTLSRERRAGTDRHHDSAPVTSYPVGAPDHPLAILLAMPALSADDRFEHMAAQYAAAVASYRLQSERTDWTLTTHARPAVLLSLSAGLYGEQGVIHAAGILGVPSTGSYRLCVIRQESEAVAGRLARRSRDLIERGWPVVATTVFESDTLLLIVDARRDTIVRAAAATIEHNLNIQAIGISSLISSLAALPVALNQAKVALANVRSSDAIHVGFFEDLGPLGQLLQHVPSSEATKSAADTLDPLLEYDQTHRSHLMQTVEAYVRLNGRWRDVASELGIHENTLYQRLQRSQEVSGLDFSNFADLARVTLALRWHYRSGTGRD